MICKRRLGSIKCIAVSWERLRQSVNSTWQCHNVSMRAYANEEGGAEGVEVQLVVNIRLTHLKA